MHTLQEVLQGLISREQVLLLGVKDGLPKRFPGLLGEAKRSRIFLGCSRRVAWVFNKILGRGGVSFTCASGTSNLERF